MNLKNRNKLLITALGCLTMICSPLSATAQNSESTNLRVSLEEAKQYAISHNHTMQNATYAERKAEAQKWQIISTMLPQVTLGYDYNNFLGNEIELMGQKIEMNPTGTFTATASMTLSGALPGRGSRQAARHPEGSSRKRFR